MADPHPFSRLATRADVVIQDVEPVRAAPPVRQEVRATTPEVDAPVHMKHDHAGALPSRRELPDSSLDWRAFFEDVVRGQLHALLAEHGLVGVEVAVQGARVRLSGVVPSPLARQLTEDLVWSVQRVCGCDNELCVAE